MQEDQLNIQKISRKWLRKQTGLLSLVESGQRLSRCDIWRQVVPRTCGNYGEGTVGGSWL